MNVRFTVLIHGKMQVVNNIKCMPASYQVIQVTIKFSFKPNYSILLNIYIYII